MNVLFTGRADIMASYLADRLYREGHHICWVTPEEKEHLLSRGFHGKIYRGSFSVEQLRRILELHGIDTVVFAYGSAVETEETKVQSQIPLLQKLLQASLSARLKHFVYLSTAELDCSSACSPRLAELQYGETLCSYYQEAHSLPVLILRLGMVYGDYPLDKMGCIGQFMLEALDGQTIENPYAEESLADLIYGEDAAVAANNLIELDKQGLYHVITGHPLAMEDMYSCLERILAKDIQVTYLRKIHTPDKGTFWKNSQKLKKETGWMPFYLLQEKGMGVLSRALNRQEESATKQEEKKNPNGTAHVIKNFFSRHSWVKELGETLALFVLMSCILPFTKGSTDFRYVDVRLLYVSLVAVMFGMRMGLVGTVLAWISYASGLRKEGIDLTFLIYSVETWIPFIIYGIAGASLGYMADRKNDTIDSEEEKYGNLLERYTFLKGLHKDALDVKGRLQHQIAASRESFGMIYEVAEQLNSLSPDKVLFHAVDVLSRTVGSCQAAIWLVSEDCRYARRKACSPGFGDELPKSLNLEHYALLLEGFGRENLFVNRELDEEYPDFAAPVYHLGKTIAIVAIYGLEVEKFTLYYQNLFKVLAGLIENSLVRALEYEEKSRDEKYLPGTEFLVPEEFGQMLSFMEEQKEKQHHTYLQLKVDNAGAFPVEELSLRLVRMIRDSDYMGLDKEGNLRILMSNAIPADLPSIQKRFAAREVEVSLW